jgi:hypothetical protein
MKYNILYLIALFFNVLGSVVYIEAMINNLSNLI